MSEATKSSPRLGPSPLERLVATAAPPWVAVFFALALGTLVLLITGKDVRAIGRTLAEELGTGYVLGTVFFKASVYTFTGLAVAYAFRAGLFNIGGEGQMLVGAFAMAMAGAWAGNLPWPLGAVIALAAGALAGAAWAFVPAILRARLAVHEVVTTIMFNLIAPPLVLFFLGLHRKAHEAEIGQVMRTVEMGKGAWLPSLDGTVDWFEGSQASWAVPLAPALALALAWVIARTRTGFELRAVGHNPEAARASGIDPSWTYLRALLVAGAIAGVASCPFVLGDKHWYEDGMLAGAGFTGIAVAVLGGNRPIRVVLAALGLALLAQSGEIVNGHKVDQVRKEIVQVLTALIIVAVLVAQNVASSILSRRQARSAPRG